MLGVDITKELLKDSTRLTIFLQECLLLGSLRGFRHFETFVRGREELILCVYTDQHQPEYTTLMPQAILEKIYPKKAVEWKTQTLISPSDKDLSQEKERIVFLIAGYAMYRCPYVWLRSHQKEYLRTQTDKDDHPLHLKKTMEWKNSNVSLWEIVTEILSMTTKPDNPFELDLAYIDNLPLEEAILLTSSLLCFLENVWIQADPSVIFMDKVYHDIQWLQSKHLDKRDTYVRKRG